MVGLGTWWGCGYVVGPRVRGGAALMYISYIYIYIYVYTYIYMYTPVYTYVYIYIFLALFLRGAVPVVEGDDLLTMREAPEVQRKV